MTSSKHDYANYEQFAPNFDMAYETVQGVSTKFEVTVVGPMTIELWAREVRELFIKLYGKISWWAFCCPLTWLLNINVWRFSKL